MSRKIGSRFTRPINMAMTITRVGKRATISLLAAVFVVGSSTRAAESNPALLHCDSYRCGLIADGAYANLVIGRVDHVGTAADMTEVLHWAKTHGYWTTLPASEQVYLHDVKLVRLAFPKGMKSAPATLFMLQSEYHSAPFHVGDLVRYAPHDAAHDEVATGSAADLALFHGLTGCVAILCRKSDKACFARYRQGAFTTKHGQAVSLATGRLILGRAHRSCFAPPGSLILASLTSIRTYRENIMKMLGKLLLVLFLASPAMHAWANGTSANDPNANTCGDSGDGSRCGSSKAHGMPVYSFKSLLAGLNVQDTPIGYTPPLGPAVETTMTYNERETLQPTVFNTFNVGQKWTLNWVSWIQDDPASPGSNVLRYVAGGGGWPYTGYNAATGAFSPEPDNGAVLVMTSANPITYELRFADGRKDIFAGGFNYEVHHG